MNSHKRDVNFVRLTDLLVCLRASEIVRTQFHFEGGFFFSIWCNGEFIMSVKYYILFTAKDGLL